MATRRDQAKMLVNLLGDDHDLTVLKQTLLTHASEVGEAHLQGVLRSIDARQSTLRERALEIGEPLYAEKPRGFRAQINACWQRSLRDAAME